MKIRHRIITKAGDIVKFDSIKKLKDNIGCAAIELYSDKRVIVMECKSIIDYSAECIVLDIGERKVRIIGENMVADSFSLGQTDIKGKIFSLEFI